MINKSFFDELDISVVIDFCSKFDFKFEISNYILYLQKDKIEIQIWNDCSTTFYDVKIINKKLPIFYLFFHKNKDLAKSIIIDYQTQKSVTEKIKFVFNLIEHDFCELISLNYSKLDTYFFYTDEDYLAYIHKVQNREFVRTRNLSKLTETKEFQELINSYPIKFFTKNGNIILSSNNIYVYIYSYIIENVPYFHIFDIHNRTYCFDINIFISDIINNDILKIYDFYKDNHNISVISEGISGEVTVEAYFFIKIEILKKYFSDLLNGEIGKYIKYFEPLRGGYIDMFNELRIFVEEEG